MVKANLHFFHSDFEYSGPAENRTKMAATIRKRTKMGAIAVRNRNVKMFGKRMLFGFTSSVFEPLLYLQLCSVRAWNYKVEH